MYVSYNMRLFSRRAAVTLLAAISFILLGCSQVSWNAGAAPPDAYYHYMKSYYAEISDDDSVAVKEMAKAAKAAGDSYFLELETAKLYSRIGQNEEALKFAQRAIQLKPEEPDAHLFAAWLAANAENWPEAETQYLDVLRLDPNNQEALVYLGAVYAESDRPEEAEKVFKRLVAADPSSLSYYYLGRLYNNSGQHAKAINAFKASIQKDPSFTAALTELAILYEQAGQNGNAENTYRQLIKARPEANMPKARLARLLLKNGRKAEARQLLSEVGGRAQDSNQAQLQIGIIYMDQKLFNEAVAEFKTVLKADPENDQARYLLATALFEQGDNIKAREYLMQIPSGSELFVDARLLLSATAVGDGQTKLEEALAIIIGAAKVKPDDPRLVVAKSMVYEEMGDFNKAHKALTGFLEKFPEEAEVQFRLGVVEDALENKEATIAAMKKTLELNPRHADALNYLAYTWAERGINLKDALDMAEKADVLKPNNGYIVDTLGWIYYQMADYKKSFKYLKRAADLSGGEPVVLEHLGDVLIKLKRPQEALETYQKSKNAGHVKPELIDEKINKLETER